MRDCMKRIKEECKEELLSTQSKGEGLDNVFKAVVNNI